MPAVTSAALGISKAGAIASGLGKVLSFAGGLKNAFSGSGGDRSHLDRHAILRRVRDAKEAGIHPLFALGASVGYSPTISTGSAVGDALQYGGNALQDLSGEQRAKKAVGMADPLYAANVRAANASAARDEAQAVYTLSQNARETTAARSRSLDSAILSNPDIFGSAITAGRSKIVPAEITSARPGDPSTTAGGATPGFSEIAYGSHGRTMSAVRQDIADSEIVGAILQGADAADRAGLLDGWLARYYRWLARQPKRLSSMLKKHIRLAPAGSRNLRNRK